MVSKEELKGLIMELIGELGSLAVTEYRQPLVGMARASNPLFLKLKEVIGEDYLQPEDLLLGAKTVVAYFIPFAPPVIEAQKEGVSQEWAQAYIETNNLIEQVNKGMKALLEEKGIATAYEAPTHYFHKEKLISQWSHKHTAFIAGLGTFGHHQMLITKKGCGGRFGSLLVDVSLGEDPIILGEYCLLKAGQECGLCIKNCPVGALKKGGEMDKKRCYQNLLAQDTFFCKDHSTQICGLCAIGPCALKNPVG